MFLCVFAGAKRRSGEIIKFQFLIPANRAYPAVLLTQVSDTTHSMIGYKYLLAAV